MRPIIETLSKLPNRVGSAYPPFQLKWKKMKSSKRRFLVWDDGQCPKYQPHSL